MGTPRKLTNNHDGTVKPASVPKNGHGTSKEHVLLIIDIKVIVKQNCPWERLEHKTEMSLALVLFLEAAHIKQKQQQFHMVTIGSMTGQEKSHTVPPGCRTC